MFGGHYISFTGEPLSEDGDKNYDIPYAGFNGPSIVSPTIYKANTARENINNVAVPLFAKDDKFIGSKLMISETHTETQSFFIVNSLEKLWSLIIATRVTTKSLNEQFPYVHYHEMLGDSLKHHYYMGVYFDVDVPFTGDNFQEKKDSLLEKVIYFETVISSILTRMYDAIDPTHDKTKKYSQRIIYDSSKVGKKVSFHGLVKHRHLVFKHRNVVLVVLLEAIYTCFEEKGSDFFHEPLTGEGTQPIWFDAQIYRSNGSLRCLYSSKIKDITRPVLPFWKNGKFIEWGNSAVSKNYFYESLIYLPMWWISNKASLHVIDCTMTKENELITMDFINDYYKENLHRGTQNINFFVKGLKTALLSFRPINYKIDTVDSTINLNGDMDSTILTLSKVHCHNSNPREIWLALASKFREIYKGVANDYKDQNLSIDKTLESWIDCVTKIEEFLSRISVKDMLVYSQNNSINFSVTDVKSWESNTPTFFDIHIEADYTFICQYFECKIHQTEESCQKENKMSKEKTLHFLKLNAFKKLLCIFKSTSTFCRIKNGNHASNHVFFMVDLLKKEWWQGCWDTECTDNYYAKVISMYKTTSNYAAASEDRVLFGKTDKFNINEDDEVIAAIYKAQNDLFVI
jgi:hypothetical protein